MLRAVVYLHFLLNQFGVGGVDFFFQPLELGLLLHSGLLQLLQLPLQVLVFELGVLEQQLQFLERVFAFDLRLLKRVLRLAGGVQLALQQRELLLGFLAVLLQDRDFEGLLFLRQLLGARELQLFPGLALDQQLSSGALVDRVLQLGDDGFFLADLRLQALDLSLLVLALLLQVLVAAIGKFKF